MRRTQPWNLARDPLGRDAHAQPRWWSRLLDGAHPWGSYGAVVGRHGVRRYQLTIYPPGATACDRRLARVWRGWPITGAVLALSAVVLLGDLLGDAAAPDTVLAWAMTAYVVVGVLLFLRAGPARVRVRSASIILVPGAGCCARGHGYAEWETLVRMLVRADQLLAGGHMSVVEHEAIWWEAYDRLPVLTQA